jgi:beta-lactamase regulating signal transducer with metallopeptidase domain
MNFPPILASPVPAAIFKGTCLLAIGWIIHWSLRNRHARWRMILWRGILCLGLTLPWLHLLHFPALKVPVANHTAYLVETEPAPVTLTRAPHAATPATPQTMTPNFNSGGNSQWHPEPSISARHASWKNALALVWILGCAWATLRLFQSSRKLSSLRKKSLPASPALEQLANQIRQELRIPARLDVRISEEVNSPFVCGLARPAIILPRTLMENLSAAETSALLRHEIAHLRGHDLLWCVVWQWARAICWFHPLVWHIPAAHNLACEQEADSVASAQEEERDSYPRLLATLTLRVVALPDVETRLTVNGSSHIVRRLNHLRRDGIAAWDWRHSAAGFGLLALLFAITAGYEFSKTARAEAEPAAPVQFKQFLVVVQDEDGKPIEGATIRPDGFRVKGIHAADAYGWNKKLFGEPTNSITDKDGKAYVNYPVMGIPEEKELTKVIVFSVSHPGFTTVRPQEYSVDSPEEPIRLARGIHLEVSGYFGSDHQPVTELVPQINQEMMSSKDWQKKDNGVFAADKLSAGGHLLQLMGRLPSGEIVYSDTVTFDAQKGQTYTFNLEMKPGIRIEGRVDDRVPRPVTNGRVIIAVRPPQFPAWTNYEEINSVFKYYDDAVFWKSYRPIAEDGTFVFESVPPGGLDVTAIGDGFVSKNGGEYVKNFAVPQAFPLVAPLTKIEVATEPTATLELTTKTSDGSPIEGASVYLNPNVIRIGGIFGMLHKSSEEPFRTMTPLTNMPFQAKTDENGVAVIRNVPAITHGMNIDHPQFQVPLQDPDGWRGRHVQVEFVAGQTNHIELTLEPKGASYIGSK